VNMILGIAISVAGAFVLLAAGYVIGGTVAWYKGWDEGFREGFKRDAEQNTAKSQGMHPAQ
jgi:hypothetical protein